MSRQYSDNQTLQQKIIRGANVLADNVASTLGPRGRNVLLQEKGQTPFITKDGVTYNLKETEIFGRNYYWFLKEGDEDNTDRFKTDHDHYIKEGREKLINEMEKDPASYGGSSFVNKFKTWINDDNNLKYVYTPEWLTYNFSDKQEGLKQAELDQDPDLTEYHFVTNSEPPKVDIPLSDELIALLQDDKKYKARLINLLNQ